MEKRGIRMFFSMLLFCIYVQAQDSSYTFNLAEVGVKFSISPDDSVLIMGVSNPLEIHMEGEGKIFATSLSGGSIRKKSDHWVARIDSGCQTVLSVYYKGLDNKNHLGFTKHYSVYKMPEPKAIICGVAPDSASTVDDLVSKNGLIVHWGYPIDITLPVVSFQMSYYNPFQRKIVTLKANGDMLTKNMLLALGTCKEGSLISFDRIRYLAPNNEIKTTSSNIYVLE